jgi:hypothetical protein
MSIREDEIGYTTKSKHHHHHGSGTTSIKSFGQLILSKTSNVPPSWILIQNSLSDTVFFSSIKTHKNVAVVTVKCRVSISAWRLAVLTEVFCAFVSVPPGKCWYNVSNQAMIASFHILFSPLLINHPIIQCYIV